MKVLDLRCDNGHLFEGWFGSDDDFMAQNGGGLIECPMCADKVVMRMPSAPRLNLSGARDGHAPHATAGTADAAAVVAGKANPPSAAITPNTPFNHASHTSPNTPLHTRPVGAPELQAAWLATVRHLMANTEDVGPRFAEEARRIHYGEKPQRGIRGQATAEERSALQEEGIETMAVPVPRGLDGPLQ